MDEDMQKPSGRSFTEIDAWKMARKLKNRLSIIASSFPSGEKYRLSDQIIRRSKSICANIAEGHGRYTYKDQIHFCIQARGSLSETYIHWIDALDNGFIDKESLTELKTEINECEKLLMATSTGLEKGL